MNIRAVGRPNRPQFSRAEGSPRTPVEALMIFDVMNLEHISHVQQHQVKIRSQYSRLVSLDALNGLGVGYTLYGKQSTKFKAFSSCT